MILEELIQELGRDIKAIAQDVKILRSGLNRAPYEDSRYLTRKQVSEYLSIGKSTVDYWASIGKLIKHRHGKTVRFDKYEIDASMTSGSLSKYNYKSGVR